MSELAQHQAINAFINLGGMELFDWEKLVNIHVENVFDPFKRKKYDALVQGIDNIASTEKGRDLLIKIGDVNGVISVVEGRLVKDGFCGPSMDYENRDTCHYDHRDHCLSISFEELDRMVFDDEETGEKQRLSIEYVLYYLLLHATENPAAKPPPELANYTNHVR